MRSQKEIRPPPDREERTEEDIEGTGILVNPEEASSPDLLTYLAAKKTMLERNSSGIS